MLSLNEFNKKSRYCSKIDKKGIKYGNNLYLIEYNGYVGVLYHRTVICLFNHDTGNVTLNTNGWHTVTTKKNINKFIKGTIYQKNFNWYYRDINGLETDYFDYMSVPAL